MIVKTNDDSELQLFWRGCVERGRLRVLPTTLPGLIVGAEGFFPIFKMGRSKQNDIMKLCKFIFKGTLMQI